MPWSQSGTPLPVVAVRHPSKLTQVFLGTGETLCTRMYRRVPPAAAKGAGIALVAHGGMMELTEAQAYEMRTIWSAKQGL